MMTSHGFLKIFGILLISTSLFAGTSPANPVFISPNSINIINALPPPPILGSKKEEKDFSEMLILQNTRTMADCNRAAAIATNYKLNTLFGPPYGPLTEKETAALEPFFDKVQSDINYFSYEEKSYWNRKRPYVENEAIVPCPNIKKDKSPAYPSGHTTVSRVFARLLSKMDPSRKEAFEARADQIATDRIMSGFHHPSDIEAGKKFGDEIYHALVKNKSFVKQLSDLREQLSNLDEQK